MGTMIISDAVTGQPIDENHPVVAYLLIDAASEYGTQRILNHCETGAYRSASLPIHGVWDGNYIHPNDDQNCRVNLALSIFKNTQESQAWQSFEDIQRALYENPTRHMQCSFSQTSTFSLMVLREDTVKKLVKHSEFARYGIDPDVAVNLSHAHQLLHQMKNKMNFDTATGLGDGDKLRAIGLRMEARTLGFELSMAHEGIRPSLAAGAFHGNNSLIFSRLLFAALMDKHLSGDDLLESLSRFGEIPADYDEIHNGIFEGMLLKHCMRHLNYAIKPSDVIAYHRDDDARFNFQMDVLKDEFSARVNYAVENLDERALDVIGRATQSMKQMIVKHRTISNDLERNRKTP